MIDPIQGSPAQDAPTTAEPMLPGEAEVDPRSPAERTLVVRTRPAGPTVEQRARAIAARVTQAAAASIDLGEMAPEQPAPPGGRGPNGQFRSALKQRIDPPDATPSEMTATDDPNEVPTRPDVPAPNGVKPSRLDRLEQRAKEERARRAASLTMKDVEQQRREFAQQQQAFAQQQQAFAQQMQALRSGDPSLLSSLLDTIGPDRVSQFLLEESTPERRAARSQRQQQPAPPHMQPHAPQQQPATDPRIDELYGLVKSYIVPQQQQAVERQFQDLIRGAGGFEFGKGGTPLTARLLDVNPKQVMDLAGAAFQQLRASGKSFDDADVALTIEENLQGLTGLYAPQAPPAKAPTPPAAEPSPIRIANGQAAPRTPSSNGQLRKSSGERLKDRTAAAMRAMGVMNGRK